MTIDPESIRLVLDLAHDELERCFPSADSPMRIAFEEVAAAVGWTWYPDAPDEPTA